MRNPIFIVGMTDADKAQLFIKALKIELSTNANRTLPKGQPGLLYRFLHQALSHPCATDFGMTYDATDRRLGIGQTGRKESRVRKQTTGRTASEQMKRRLIFVIAVQVCTALLDGKYQLAQHQNGIQLIDREPRKRNDIKGKHSGILPNVRTDFLAR